METKYIMDRELLENRLKELAATPYAGKICEGAMCYMPLAPATSAYKCIVCSKRTSHTFGANMVRELLEARGIVDELKARGYDVRLSIILENVP